MPRLSWIVAAGIVAAPGPAVAAELVAAPDAGGILVVSTSSATEDDARLGRIAARLASRGLESFVASDCLRPPPDPERRLVHGRWRLDDARRARRVQRLAAAAASGDEAIRIIQLHAFERQHLDLLVEAIVERAAIALDMQDPATAEALFLSALALDPLLELDAEAHGAEMTQVFNDVRRASRELRFGSLKVDVPGLPEATVSIDFGSPQEAPVTVNLPDGRHFVSVSAPARHEVVALVPVRAERETAIHVRPPMTGDTRARAEVISRFSAATPDAVQALSTTTGLRFVLAAERQETGLALALYDGRTGRPVTGADGTLSVDPSPDEIDAAVTRLLAAAMVLEPALDPRSAEPGWYTEWWGVALIGAALAGAAAATALVVRSRSDTTYGFEP
ncbi:hypothetical protein L6R52_12335 [Myxococcota bacterium]|nr:hypothetical protein [Myxococcota bacterium]